MRLLDLFCCEGGAGMGYARAGFDVFGVDLFEDYSQKRYPFPSHKGDALEFVREHGHEFDAVHASPPCQHASAGTRALRNAGKPYVDLVAASRAALRATGLPYIIENVTGAALESPVTLCWSMFHEAGSVVDEDGTPLRMERHRLFESNMLLHPPTLCRHETHVQVAGSYGGARRTVAGAKERRGGYVPSKSVQQELMGVDWMTERGMHQAIPPDFTAWLGTLLLEQLRVAA